MINTGNIIRFFLAVSMILISITNPVSAIGPKTVKGQILDKDNNPISGVTVLLSLDGRNIGGIITDVDGRFELQFEPGDNDICSLNILSENYQGIFSDVEIYEDTTYVEYTLETKPRGMI